MMPPRDQEIKKLIGIAGSKGVIAKEIMTDTVVVSQWVRFKCRYGCKGYAKHLSCPPYAPTPSETAAMIKEIMHAFCQQELSSGMYFVMTIE